jgi:Bifunctional DNA primase/polymerase, N-terminal/MutS domain I
MKAKSLLDQWVDLKEDFPRHIVLIQCGVFYETYQEDAEFLSEILNIKTFLRGPSNVAGFPIKAIQKYQTSIEGLGYAVVVVDEIAWDGKNKIRGINYVTGKANIAQDVQEYKREITAVTPKKAASKTLETLGMSKSLKAQYRVDIALTQIGYMFNAFDDDAKILSERIGLKSFEKYGFLTVGFPVNAKETYFGKIKEAQLSFITIVETEKDSSGSIRQFGEVFPKEEAEHPVKDLHSPVRSIKPIDQNSLKAAALAHAKNGFYVIPLVENSKRPLISDWQNRATTNPLQIDSWWTEHPNANIGIACEVSNLIVIDLDTSKGAVPSSPWNELGAKNGEDVLKEICRKAGDSQIFETYSVKTPSGGKHLYFYDQNIAIKQGTEVNGWWRVDTRSKGGYIVAEGSRLINSSKGEADQYQSIGNSVVLNFPAWLRDELSPKAIKENFVASSSISASYVSSNPFFSREFAEQVLLERCTLIRNTPEGRRNQSLIKHATYIGKIIGMGSLDEKFASDSLLEAAISSGLTKFESVNAIKAGIKYGKNLVH